MQGGVLFSASCDVLMTFGNGCFTGVAVSADCSVYAMRDVTVDGTASLPLGSSAVTTRVCYVFS